MMLEYMGWREAADLINAAYPKVIADKTVTYDFARQMQGAQEVSTSGFGDCLINKIQSSGVVLVEEEARRRQVLEEDRKEREAQRVANPVEAMQVSGRVPQNVGAIMHPILVVEPTETVNIAMQRMREQNRHAVLIGPDERHDEWGIMTKRDVMQKIISANRSTSRAQVGEIASRPVQMVPRETSLRDAAARMVETNVRRLVIAKDGKPIGIVSDTDLFLAVEEFGWEPEVL
jgi:isocitrate dehydrogenase